MAQRPYRARNRPPRRGNYIPNRSPSHPPLSNPLSNPPSNRYPQSQSIPSFAFLTPGTPVSMILKPDQPTGYQVRGIVADILTRGDHPRGVKVRLRDGRVGRVQGVVSEAEGLIGESLVGGENAGLGRDGESVAVGERAERGERGGRGRRAVFRHVSDVRDDNGYLWDEEAAGKRNLGTYFTGLEELEALGNTASPTNQQHVPTRQLELQTETVKCPVCGEFEGDETAVQHHVESHFQDSA
ncbi:uncharacterized protein BDR25DRAFT_41729 [Lindgomyces ingoldianus]|uniref:Uncharacterized protein n=1 Tax=Lindgomyces ingoldianus TaxID=673940 RepID=A0ACB6RDQ9_9PLEO|nr:uncharacterized protein BDR25DRAFT_41729 [Lindgomyces ingoldianus]KAF2476860.1 hypothetical protein BDR25DRAFT_41729 [Lindgomyces ingoldianus]